MNLRVLIEPAIRASYPALQVRVLRAKGKLSMSLDESRTQIDAACEALRASDISIDHLSEHEVVAAWRNAYRAFGASPSKFKSSIEALMRRALKGGSLATPIALVNLYNAASLRHLTPLGAYDVSLLPAGPIELRYSRPTDTFAPLGGEAKDFPLSTRTVVYASENRVLCWGFNCRDARDAALREATEELVVFAESFDDRQAKRAEDALIDLQQQLGAGFESVSFVRITEAGVDYSV